MEQLVKAKHLIELVVGQKGGVVGQTSWSQGGAQSPPLEVIEVIHAATIGVSASCQRGILNITTQQEN